MKKKILGLGVASIIVLSFVLSPLFALADPYDPIIGFRNSDDTADTAGHIVNMVPYNFAVYGTRYEGNGGQSAYYFSSLFNIQTAPTGFGSSNYKIDLDLGAVNICNVGDLCDHVFPVVTGHSGQYLTNNGFTSSWAALTLPSVGTAGTYGAVTTDAQGRVTAGKRMETYSGTTNGSGVYTVTFATAYSVAPNIQANITNGTDTQSSRITSISTTGFTVLARNRTDVVGLLPAYANATGVTIDVLITEK